MKKFIKNIFLLVIICCLLIVPVNYLAKNNDGHYVYRMMNEMYESKQNIDVLFLGSSHVYRSYDPKIADKILGLKTFNAGSSAQGMNTSYYLLKEICRYHRVKTVYLDTYFGMANIPDDDAQVFVLSDYMRAGKNKTDLLLSNGGVKALVSGYLTFSRGNWNIIRNIKSNFSEIGDYSTVSYDNEEYRGEGFVFSFEVCDPDDEKMYLSYADLTDLSAECPANKMYTEHLLKMIDFCRENNIELVLVNQPMPRKTMDYVTGYDNYVNFIRQIADGAGIKYWNFDLFNGDVGLTMTDYKDGDHLNGKGAEKYTEFFCNFATAAKEGKIGYDAFRKSY